MDQSKASIINLHGEYDLGRRKELDALFTALPANSPATIGLRDVSYADSTFLSALVALAIRLKGAPVTLLSPQPQILRVLKIVNFDKLFSIVES